MKLDFSAPVFEETLFGTRKVQYARPTPEFWRAWRRAEGVLNERGLGIYNSGSGWMVKRVTMVAEDAPAPEVQAYEISNKAGLHTYQVPHAGQLCAAVWRYRVALDASDTGTGKTYVALAVTRELNLTPAVVCLKSAIAKWDSVCQLFKVRPQFIANWDAAKSDRFPLIRIEKKNKFVPLPAEKLFIGEPLRYNDTGRVVTDQFRRIVYKARDSKSRNLFVVKLSEEEYLEVRVRGRKVERHAKKVVTGVRWLLDPEKILLIFDEAHKAKGENTINSKILVAAKPYRTLLLSATIAANPRQMRGVGYLLGLHSLSNFNQWCNKYDCFEGEHNDWECVDAKGAMARLSKEIFPLHGGRLRIADLGDQFPETQISADLYEIENSGVQNEAYDRLILEIEKLKSKGGHWSEQAMTLQLRYRQLSELLKVTLLCEMAENYVENGLSVVIFVNFRETLDAVCGKLGVTCVIHGTQSQGDREKNRLDFQHGRARIIGCMIEAGGTSIDLHDEFKNYPRISLLCPTWNPVTLKQALGRIHRDGGTKSLQRLIYAKGTVEEDVCKTVAARLEAISALNDGDLAEPDIFRLLAA